jgi:hypothetical protein
MLLQGYVARIKGPFNTVQRLDSSLSVLEPATSSLENDGFIYHSSLDFNSNSRAIRPEF